MIDILFYFIAAIGILSAIQVVITRNTQKCLIALGVLLATLMLLITVFSHNILAAIIFALYAIITLLVSYFLIKRHKLVNDSTEKAEYGISPKRWFAPALFGILFIMMLYHLILTNDYNDPMPLLLNISYGELTLQHLLLIVALMLFISIALLTFYLAIKSQLNTEQQGSIRGEEQ